MTSTLNEVLKLALEFIERVNKDGWILADFEPQMYEAIASLRQAIAELESQEPVAYDKTEINFFVQDLYDKKMQEGKHGHYETMFHVVHQAIKRANPPQRTEQNFCPRCGKRTNDIHTCTPPQRTWVELTDEEIDTWNLVGHESLREFVRAIEAKLKEKNS